MFSCRAIEMWETLHHEGQCRNGTLSLADSVGPDVDLPDVITEVAFGCRCKMYEMSTISWR